MSSQNISKQTLFTNPLLWGIFILYVIILGFTIAHHELWGDEIHSWNIAKASNSFSDLISNTRYEGHPPVWYIILWSISKFTHNVYYIQLVQGIIACAIVFLILFFSQIPVLAKILIPFGYFFLFEYGVLSRNYAIGILPAFIICVILHKNFRYRIIVYYVLLFLLSNTHLLALLLACSLHLYFLLLNIEQKKKKSVIALHILLGTLILLPSVYFIFPPQDSGLNTHFFLDRWNANQLTALIQPPLRSFIPVPAWWNYNFWNTQFLLEAQNSYPLLRIVSAITVLMLFVLIFLILKKNKKSLALFAFNLILSFITALIFSLTTPRYAGFIFIGFIVAYWLYCHETSADQKSRLFVNILLAIQIMAGVFAIIKDIQFPFSIGYKAKELVNEVPGNKKIVTDYWTLNPLEAFTDKPFYCLELHKEMSFLMWNSELSAAIISPDLYSNGIKYLFQKDNIKDVYMISIHSLQNIAELDAQLLKSFDVTLVDKKEGAIEKGGNLYLYEIKAN